MSYILEALKKAEREREIRQVPTLMAAHEKQARNRKGRWAVIGLSVLCVAVAIWYALTLRREIRLPAPSQTAAVGERATGKSGAPPTQAPAQDQAQELAGGKPASANEERQAAASAPGATVPAKPADAGRLIRNQARIDDDFPEDNPGEDEAGAPPRISELRPSSPAVAKIRPGSAPKPSPAGAMTEPLSLEEALGTMTLSLLVFDENKADRMIFINGRKYVEGDIVEGGYLVEAITLEGAELSFRGERALLRPKSK